MIWWALVFGVILNAGVLSWREASICIVDSSGLCQAVAALCLQSHPLNIRVYSPGLLYVSFALLGTGALAGLIGAAWSFEPQRPSAL